MNSFLYGTALQFKLDIRSKSMLITCYLVPLAFFCNHGWDIYFIDAGNPKHVDSVHDCHGSLNGSTDRGPPSLVEIYGSDIKQMYRANGIPLYFGLISLLLSAFIHLLIMSALIFLISPIAFHAVTPPNPATYFCKLILFIAVSLSIASVLGLMVKSQSKLTMYTQLIFLPSIMLSGIMFPADLLPGVLEALGKLFPATWSYILLSSSRAAFGDFLPLLIIFAIASVLCVLFIKASAL